MPAILLACLVALLLAKVVIVNGPQLLGYTFALAVSLLSFLFGFSVLDFFAGLLPALLILIWIGYCFGRIFGIDGNEYFKFVARSMLFVGHGTMVLLKFMALTAGRLVAGSGRTADGEK